MRKNAITLALFTVLSLTAQAEETAELEEVKVSAQGKSAGEILNNTPNISDHVIYKEKLKTRSATLGNALSGELGIHSNPFGGGASKPIIRGQDGVRVKILQNGTDVIDMSALSPDHVVATDTLLANKVELVRGANTLLYSTASPAGVVNVVDGRIPTQMPNGLLNEKIEGEALLRYNTGSREKVATAGVSLALTDHIVARIEGLKRSAKDYKVPEFRSDKVLNYLPDSDNKSTVGTFGLSYIGEKGFIGASYSKRRDKYGIPGHNHNYDSCTAHFISAIDNPERAVGGRYYLNAYPHLMDDQDIVDAPHFDGCKVADNGEDHGHSHDNPFGFHHNHNHRGPWVDMKMSRYDLRGELHNPIRWLEKVKLSLTYADYYHDERDPGNPERRTGIAENYTSRDDYGHAAAIFKNKGVNSRFELHHSPIHLGLSTLKGLVGIQYQRQKSSALTPYLPSYGATPAADPRNLLVPHTNKNLSLFGLEELKIGNFTFETAVRWERQKTPVDYNRALLTEKLERYKKGAATVERTPQHPDLTPYKESAVSYSGSFLWDFAPNHKLNLIYSHNERLPTPMELYYSGKHLATNSFEYGNKDLKKEKSDNVELGLAYQGEKFGYKANAYYSKFDNYIFNENIVKKGNLYIRRYNQTTARFYGLEGEIILPLNENHQITLFGDVVRGKIGNLSPVKGKLLHSGRKFIIEDDLKGQSVDSDGYYDPNGGFTCANKTADEWAAINTDNECTTEINVYKNGTTTPGEEDYDVLERKSTISPRLPPMRLGLRYQAAIGEHWLVNLEYSRIFKQDRVSTSTIAIKPSIKDENGKTIYYYNEKNPKKMQARKITENVTKGYNMVNVGIDYNRLIKGIDYTFTLRADNLLNEKVYIHNSFLPYVPQMGRNFTFAVNAKF
ncbi:TonB-dependent receptor [Actinobacillus vicugnae]|uniref:TonB-dependent receptor n=1 Tax=Actinobacillus vicugnae TaxID=2573093 RepID=UPI001241A0A8|nr:TonB-dependent receptor [Actinobacillus vicugnae]